MNENYINILKYKVKNEIIFNIINYLLGYPLNKLEL